MKKGPSVRLTKPQITAILDAIKDKTLGEIDSANVFEIAGRHKKVTGIAGTVIEKSVLGYGPNSSRDADLLVDDVPIELKTTGVRYIKDGSGTVQAKEPLTITAVSLPTDGSEPPIVHENFPDSHFWRKAERLLIVVYHYSSATTVQAKDYASFVIKGYLFTKFNEEDRARLENDWNIIKNFISKASAESPDPRKVYPRLSSDLRGKLVYLDTAPRYPHPPRFRLKRTFVSKIVQDHLSPQDATREHLDGFHSFTDFDRRCADIARRYSGKTLGAILKEHEINKAASKNSAERAVVSMFGGDSKKLNDLEVFSSFGLIAKTITLTMDGKRTEDIKLFSIDFNEWKNPEQKFEDSFAYSYFSDHQFFFIVFEEPSRDAPLKENIFKGFKRYTFSECFINMEVKRTWEEIGDLVTSRTLKELPELDEAGNPILNRTGKPRLTLNFPKARDNVVFVRGTGTNSRYKPEKVNGIDMYRQQLWLKGTWIAEELQGIPYLQS